MPRVKTKIASLKMKVPQSYREAIAKETPNDIDPSRGYYRVIVGANNNDVELSYTCYRKNRAGFTTGKVDFTSEKQTNDRNFIFTQNEVDNLLDYLNDFEDDQLYTIARLGQQEIDPISLLPIESGEF